MLTLASIVFLYYTIWTLLTVRSPSSLTFTRLETPQLTTLNSTALHRRRQPSRPQILPASSLGYPHPGHIAIVGRGGSWEFSERGYDPE